VIYDAERAIYRDCRWCHGRGCLQCPGEAKKAYREAFPDGPKPIASIPHDGTQGSLVNALKTAMAAVSPKCPQCGKPLLTDFSAGRVACSDADCAYNLTVRLT